MAESTDVTPTGTPEGRPKQERGDRVTHAYRRLRELIVTGRLAPGSRIIETSVAGRLGVSRTPVRAALQRLQQEGYVVVTSPGQQSRMAVAPLTQEDAIELFGMVSAVEGLAAHGAAQRPERARQSVVQELRILNRDLLEASAADRRDVNRVFTLDERFHRKVVEAGAGPRLLALHDSFKPQSERYGRIYSSALIDEMASSVKEHEDVVCAIENSDPDGAEAAMRRNWTNASQRLADVIDTLGERGTW
ncbi:MAG: GntR family transcriptional regulator [Gemmatimonadetes bacterium]|nr:GntR family transcriptional regulator [Gemmatimonadota bacterium]